MGKNHELMMACRCCISDMAFSISTAYNVAFILDSLCCSLSVLSRPSFLLNLLYLFLSLASAFCRDSDHFVHIVTNEEAICAFEITPDNGSKREVGKAEKKKCPDGSILQYVGKQFQDTLQTSQLGDTNPIYRMAECSYRNDVRFQILYYLYIILKSFTM